jgi:DNA-binding NtrC family response regulator
MNKILFVDDEESFRLLYNDEFTEEGYHVITPNDSQPIKAAKEKIILPYLFREQIEQGIKGLRHDMDSLKGGL